MKGQHSTPGHVGLCTNSSDSHNTNRPIITIRLNGKPIPALIDTGADVNLISDSLITRGSYKPVNTRLQLACEGESAKVIGNADLTIDIEGIVISAKFLVVPGIEPRIILGMPFLQDNQTILDFTRGCAYLGTKARKTIFWSSKLRTVPGEIQLPPLDNHLPQEFQDLVEEYSDLFDTGLRQPTTRTTLHKIDLKEPKIVNKRCYPMSPEKRKILYGQLNQMLQAGVIEPTTSAYASPPVLVTRPDKEPRFCVDYRAVNDITLDESTTLPRIQDCVKPLAQAKIFTLLDLKSGYWQIPMDEQSKKYTAFSTPDGASYQFTVMPFGLKNAPSTFQKLMTQEVLVGHLQHFVHVYLDDIIIYSETMEEHVNHVRKVFERLRIHKLQVSAAKCQIATQELDYLGYHIKGDITVPQNKHLKQIETFSRPVNKKQLQSFIGTCNWLREHVPHMAELMAPITDLLKTNNGKSFKWTPGADEAFKKVKNVIAQAQPLSRPDFGKTFVLQTDASSIGMSAVLYQEEGERRFIISHASAKFKPAETKYHINEQECLALVWAINTYRAYLEDKPFIVRTDSKALTWLKQFKDTKSKLTRWALLLQEYSFKIEHVAGKNNELPDLLSREPYDAPYEAVPDDDRLIPPLHPDCNNEIPLSEVQINALNAGTLYDKVAETQSTIRNIRRAKMALKLIDLRGPQSNSERKLFRRFVVTEDLLWRRHPEGDRLVVPRHLTSQVIHTYHDIEDQAHPGYQETLRQIQKHYFWGWMFKDVQNYVKKCIMCSLAKPRRQTPAPQRAHTAPKQPFETLSVDVLGPYPESKFHKNTLIVLVEDVFSKWVEAFPCQRAQSRDICKILANEIFCRYGIPKQIITDGAKTFSSDLMNNFYEQNGITHSTSSIYHQQANPVERRVQELKKVLSVLLHDKRETLWEQYLPKALQILRSRRNRATGETPAALVLGYELPCPGEWRTLWKRHIKPKKDRPKVLREAIKRTLDFQRKEYPENRDPLTAFRVGDRVNVRNRPRGAFAPMWTGPHQIVKKTGETTYDVQRDGDQVNVHVDDLRLAKEGNVVSFSDDENYDSSSESDAEEWQAIEQAITNYQPSESEDSEIQPPEPVLVDVDIHEPPRQINPNLRSDSLEAIQQINAITNTIQPFEQIIARRKNLSEKSYQEMEEAMTQACLKLDSVENPKGELAIRSARKSAIAFIEKLSGSLYHKFSNRKK